MTTLYGQRLSSEKIAEENTQCREIVAEISQFGVNQRQRMMIIYLLALELENVDELRAVCDAVREVRNDIFVSG
jgi:hypothetical protein